MLRILTFRMGVCVGKDKDSVMAHNHSLSSPHIARKPRMMSRMDVQRPHSLSDSETRRSFCRWAFRISWRHDGDVSGLQHRCTLGYSFGRLPGVNLGACHHPVLYQKFNEPGVPTLVITHSQIVSWWNQLNFVACCIEIPLAAGSRKRNLIKGGYEPALTGEDLVQAIPAVHGLAQIRVEQMSNISSSDMNADIWLQLAGRVNGLLSKPEISGVVVTHGTNTLEETAYFWISLREVTNLSSLWERSGRLLTQIRTAPAIC